MTFWLVDPFGVNLTYTSGNLPLECQKIVKKLAIILKKMSIFGNFKKMSSFGHFFNIQMAIFRNLIHIGPKSDPPGEHR